MTSDTKSHRKTSFRTFTDAYLEQVNGGSGKGASMPGLKQPNTLAWLNQNKPLAQTPNIPRVTQGAGAASVNVSASGPPMSYSITGAAAKGPISLSATVFNSPNPMVRSGFHLSIGKKF